METQTLIEKVHNYDSTEPDWTQIALELRRPPLVRPTLSLLFLSQQKVTWAYYRNMLFANGVQACRAWFETLHRLKNLVPDEDKERYKLPKKRKRRKAADVERAYPCQVRTAVFFLRLLFSLNFQYFFSFREMVVESLMLLRER